jgi:hypothetical protein
MRACRTTPCSDRRARAHLRLAVDPPPGLWSQDVAAHLALPLPVLRSADPQAVRVAARERAPEWCDEESQRWRLNGEPMLVHAARRCKPWGWGDVRVICIDAGNGTAELDVLLPPHDNAQAGRLLVGVLEGWFAGTMEWIAHQQGRDRPTRARLQPARDGHCLLLLR